MSFKIQKQFSVSFTIFSSATPHANLFIMEAGHALYRSPIPSEPSRPCVCNQERNEDIAGQQQNQ